MAMIRNNGSTKHRIRELRKRPLPPQLMPNQHWLVSEITFDDPADAGRLALQARR
jgi:hypothetical protein